MNNKSIVTDLKQSRYSCFEMKLEKSINIGGISDNQIIPENILVSNILLKT